MAVTVSEYILNDLAANHNKIWRVKYDTATGQLVTEFGRVGAKLNVSEAKYMSAEELRRLIRTKLNKGYVLVEKESQLIQSSGTIVTPGRVGELIAGLLKEANENIASYLSVQIGDLGLSQISKARDVLRLISNGGLNIQNVQAFYNLVPTKLPARIDPQRVVADFKSQLSQFESRLDQLEAAINAANTLQTNTTGLTDQQLLGAEIALLPQSDNAYDRIVRYIRQGEKHGYQIRIRDIFSVRNPKVEDAYNASPHGSSRVDLLFHGTSSKNVRHILAQGLRLPRSQTHGWAFGPGIYFANVATKSANYADARTLSYQHLLLCDVKVGKAYVPPSAADDLDKMITKGYDSVWGVSGKTSYLNYDEIIIYRPEQHNLKYIVTWER